MPIETKPFDAAEYLKTPEDVAAYLEAWLEDGTPEEIRSAMRTIANCPAMLDALRAGAG